MHRFATALLLTTLAGAAGAQQPAPAGPPESIDVDCEGIDLRDLVAQIARQTGQNLLVDPAVQERVSVSLRDIPWREAVDVVARMTRCEIEELEGGVLLLAQPPKVTLRTSGGTDVRSALRLLAANAKKNVLCAPGVRGLVDLDLEEVHWHRALEAIVRAGGLHLRQRGPALWVVSDAPLPAPAAPAAGPPDPPRKVDIDVEDVDLSDVCEQVGQAVGRPILVDPAVTESVTASLRQVPWRAAVAALARLTRCAVEERDGGLLVLTQPPRSSLQAAGAPAAAWFRLVAGYAGVDLAQGELRGAIDCDLEGVHPLEALEATAEVHGIRVERRGDTVLLVPPAEVPPAAAAPGRIDALLEDIDRLARAGDAAGLEPRLRELLAQVQAGRAPATAAPPPPPPLSEERRAELDALLDGIVVLATERKVEELVRAFADLKTALDREGLAAVQSARARAAVLRGKLEGLEEVRRALQLQLDTTEGNLHLRAMADASRSGDFARAHQGLRDVTTLCEAMRGQGSDVFRRNADALLLRARALDHEAARLERVAKVPLLVTAIVVPPPGGREVSRAIINGWITGEGEAPKDAAGEELPGLQVVQIVRGAVRLRFEDAELVRELGAR